MYKGVHSDLIFNGEHLEQPNYPARNWLSTNAVMGVGERKESNFKGIFNNKIFSGALRNLNIIQSNCKSENTKIPLELSPCHFFPRRNHCDCLEQTFRASSACMYLCVVRVF